VVLISIQIKIVFLPLHFNNSFQSVSCGSRVGSRLRFYLCVFFSDFVLGLWDLFDLENVSEGGRLTTASSQCHEGVEYRVDSVLFAGFCFGFVGSVPFGRRF
jgi:hypothetical protein